MYMKKLELFEFYVNCFLYKIIHWIIYKSFENKKTILENTW